MDAVQDRLVLDHDRVHDLDPAADPAPAQGAAVALAAVAVVAAAPNLEHTRSQNLNPSPNLPNAAAPVPNPNQETAQSRNLSQSPNPDLVLGPRRRGQSQGRSPNVKPSLPQKIDLVVNVQEVTDHDPDLGANTAKAAAVPVRQ